MSALRWLVIGIISIGVPMAAAYDRTSLWPPLITGTVAGSLFLIGLVVSSWKRITAPAERSIIVIVAAMLIAGSGLQLYQQREIAAFQRERLLSVRTTIGSGAITADKIRESMLPVLRAFHRQNGSERLPMVPFFRRSAGAALDSGMFNRQADAESDAVTAVSYRGDSVVIFHCIDTIARGYADTFVNTTGHRGKLEFYAELDEKGIRYERLN